MNPPRMLMLTLGSGLTALVPADLIGVAVEIEGAEEAGPKTRLTLRPGAFYQSLEVMEDIGDLDSAYATATEADAPATP